MKEIRQGLINGETFFVHRLEGNILKMTILFYWSTHYKKSQSKSKQTLLREMNKLTQKLYGNKGARIVKKKSVGKKQSWKAHMNWFSDFQTTVSVVLLGLSEQRLIAETSNYSLLENLNFNSSIFEGSIQTWGPQGKDTEMICHSLL